MFRNFSLKRFLVILGLVLFVSLFSGCGASSADSGSNYEAPSSPSESKDTTSDAILEGRKVYFTVNYEAKTDNIKESVTKLNEIRIKYEGFIEESTFRDGDYRSTAYYTLRIPTAKLDNFMSDFENGATYTGKTIKSTDITKKYDSNAAIVAALQAELKLYQDRLVNEADTLTVAQVNQINSEITRINKELATYVNTQNEYDALLEYSTVYVTFTQEKKEEEEVTIFTEFVPYLSGLLNVLLAIVMYTSPFALVAGVILVIIFVPKKVKAKKEKEDE